MSRALNPIGWNNDGHLNTTFTFVTVVEEIISFVVQNNQLSATMNLIFYPTRYWVSVNVMAKGAQSPQTNSFTTHV
jgi:hypothetical protein